jgi:dGTPase
MIQDVTAQSRRHIVELEPDSVEEAREAGRALVGFSAAMAQADRAIKDFLYPRLYRHARIVRIMNEAEEMVGRLFAHYRKTPGDLPPGWLDEVAAGDEVGRAVRVADYIAGMTDRYVMVEHTRIFGATPELR